MSRRDEPSPPAQTAGERWRCFVAVSLTEPARTAVVEYLERLRATVGGVAWVRAEQLHLTLKFLGNLEPARLPSLTERLQVAVVGTSPFALQVAGVGAFPSLARPQALWVGVASPRIAALAAAVESACAHEGFEPERRAFRPHVTLGRVRDRRAKPDLGFLVRDGDRDLGIAPVAAVTLFRSVLGAGGARHSVLASLPLVDAGR